jgi:hypothetical protein
MSDHLYIPATLPSKERNPVQGLDWRLCGDQSRSDVYLVAKIKVLTQSGIDLVSLTGILEYYIEYVIEI